MFFFFFQAEDGIRDIGVTGVQTCALPISRSNSIAVTMPAAPLPPRRAKNRSGWSVAVTRRKKIGRASCRGKSVDLGGRRIIKKKKNDINALQIYHLQVQ